MDVSQGRLLFLQVEAAGFFLHQLTPMMKVTESLETSVNIYPVTQHHVPEDLNLQQHRYENLKSHTAVDDSQVNRYVT
jgi:hypothetical protein